MPCVPEESCPDAKAQVRPAVLTRDPATSEFRFLSTTPEPTSIVVKSASQLAPKSERFTAISPYKVVAPALACTFNA